MADATEEDGLPPERSEEELEARHERELEEMEEKAKKHVEDARAANKGKKAKAAADAAEREAEQWLYDLKGRQQDEMDALLRHLRGESASEPAAEVPDAGPVPPSKEELAAIEAAKIQKKKEKAMRKRDTKTAKEAQRREEAEKERLEAGPSKREVELSALEKRLQRCSPPMEVYEVPSDGHCLYRAVADQLRRSRHQAAPKPGAEISEVMRHVCAASLRKRADDYSPFAELADGEDYEGYCKRVADSADWGGELELRALADELGVQIVVHRADEDPHMVGESSSHSPLQVAYHRHYYALGEHYNSVIPISSEG